MTHLNKIIEILRTVQKKDRYIISHLYGKSPEHLSELDEIELSYLIDRQGKQSTHSEISEGPSTTKSSFANEELRKLTPFETYVALIKGYCSISILLMPKAFVGGGWLVSAVFEILSAAFSTYCVTKLVQVGLEHKIHSY